MITLAAQLSPHTGKKAACEALRVPRATFYRHHSANSRPGANCTHRPAPPLALSSGERQAVFDVLHSDQFCDDAPHQVYAKLLATEPNQVWSWDITKLKGPVKWTYFYLYLIMDIFSRYVVGWMIAHREQAALAKRLINDSCTKQHIEAEQLTLHADRGSSMKSKVVAHLLSDLGVTKTHSRPHVSNDNPYSEAQFKTLINSDFQLQYNSLPLLSPTSLIDVRLAKPAKIIVNIFLNYVLTKHSGNDNQFCIQNAIFKIQLITIPKSLK